MANREIEIDVVVNTEQAEKGFDKLEEGSKAVGESFGSVGKAVSTLGGEANEALGSVGESLNGVVDGFGDLISASKEGGMSFTAMAGPIGVAVLALFELIEAVREYSNETSGANIRNEAYIASTAELTSAVEELAAAQVKLNQEQIKELRVLSMSAKLPLEQAQMIREKNAALDKSIQSLKDEIAQIEKSISATNEHTQSVYANSIARREAANRQQNLIRLREKLSKKEAEADRLTQEGAENFAKFEAKKEELLKLSPEFRKQIADQEAKLLSEARIAELQGVKDSVDAQREIATIGSKQKIADLKAIEDIAESVRSQAIAAERKRLQAEISDIEKAASEKRRAEAEKRRNQMALERARSEAQRLARERQLQAELQQIRSLEIESARINGASALDVLNMRYQEEVRLAEDNANKILIAVKKYENQVTQIQQQEDAQRFAMEQQQAQQRANLIYDTLEFEANLTKDQTEKQLRLLEIRYARELELNSHTQEEITELNRRQAIERQNIINQSIDAQIEKIGEFSTQYGAGIAEAAYASLLFGESFNEAIGQMLIGLGRQAAVQSLMEVAKGTAALILNPAAAGNHFAAAGLFAGASAAAGVAGKALGGGGGGASSGGVASPTGTPQTAPAPEREQAEQTAMVFNINFGGAVIYDTQRAAEQALADRITNLQNTRRRGAPRRAY
jgi:hypothetical protein